MVFPAATKNRIILTVTIATLLTVAIETQLKYDAIMHPKIVFTTETRYILPTVIVKNFSFGFKAVIADLYWVKAIQDFSIWDGKDPFYLQEYKNVTALDPKFSYPYLLGILTFTSRSVDDRNSTSTILDTLEPTVQIGIQSLPTNWEIPFYMGTGYQLDHNTEKALYYLKLASSHEDAPDIIHQVYKTYLKNTLMGKTAAGKDASSDLIKAIYQTTESETTKKILEEGVRVNDLTEILDGMTQTYYKKYGYYPSSLDDLASHGIIKITDALTKEFRITFNDHTGKVTVTARKVNNQ